MPFIPNAIIFRFPYGGRKEKRENYFMTLKQLLIVLFLWIGFGFNAHISQAQMPYCDTLEPAIQHPGSNCIIRPAGATAPVVPANPDDLLNENNAYTGGGKASNGQDFSALGGVAFTAHPFMNEDGTLTCYNATDPNDFVTFTHSQLSQPGTYDCVRGSYIEVTADGECLFYGAFPDGKVAAGGLPISCPPMPIPTEDIFNGIGSETLVAGSAVGAAAAWGVYEYLDDDDDAPSPR